jgi:hypothetical protein
MWLSPSPFLLCASQTWLALKAMLRGCKGYLGLLAVHSEELRVELVVIGQLAGAGWR